MSNTRIIFKEPITVGAGDTVDIEYKKIPVTKPEDVKVTAKIKSKPTEIKNISIEDVEKEDGE